MFKDEIEELFEYDESYGEDELTYISITNECGLTLNELEGKISIYKVFSYYDISEAEYFKSDIDDKDLRKDFEADEQVYLLQKAFENFVKKRNLYEVSIWDDGAYMCPGFIAYVGFYECEEDINLVKAFLRLVDEFDQYLENYLNIRELLLDEYRKDNLMIFSGRKNYGVKMISTYKEFSEDYEVKCYYKGTEYFLVRNSNQYWVSIDIINCIYSYFENYEYIQKLLYYIVDNKLYITNTRIVAEIELNKSDTNYSNQIEEQYIMSRVNEILPFASNRFQKFVDEYYKFNINKMKTDLPLIITEGATDWRHLEWAWKQINDNPKYSGKFSKLEISFKEFEPENAECIGKEKISMGGDELLQRCKHMSETDKNDQVYIFIADRDVPKINSKMSENNCECYKDWGNHVYSFVLPIPEHRQEIQDICIEHYYTDDELKTEIECKDGIKRRIYLSNEFDKYGRGLKINKFCTNRHACQDIKKIKILDGSGNDKILSLTNIEDVTNYALSKMAFADAVYNNKFKFKENTYERFIPIFEMIYEIIQKETEKNN